MTIVRCDKCGKDIPKKKIAFMGNEIEIFDKGTVHCLGWSLGLAFRNNNITTNPTRNEKTLFI